MDADRESQSFAPADVARLLGAWLAATSAEIGALSQAQLSWRPAAGQWCINEVVGHVKQIFDNVGALAWPHMGNSRRFSRPDLPEL